MLELKTVILLSKLSFLLQHNLTVRSRYQR